ncbi:hypothetical protein [Micromonospora sp. NPDC093244]|uniref:hypothetical protein n=1 Tax=Micromonospora sp. NPDC093244 TaxID=3155071 RepID=UPI003420F194
MTDDTYPDGTPLPRCIRCGQPIEADEPICHRGFIWSDHTVKTTQWMLENPAQCAHPRCVFDFNEMLGLNESPNSQEW